MKILSFEWDWNNIEHIARHQVYPNEAEEACANKPYIVLGRTGRYYVHGRTNDGRYLFLVIKNLGDGHIRIITARNMDETEKRLYRRKK